MVDEDKIEDLIEDKVCEYFEDKHNNEYEESDSSSRKNMSRRDFLKKLGVGAAGLSAISLMPSASAFNIRTSNPFQYFGDNQTDPNFSVQPNGSLDTDTINASIMSVSQTTAQVTKSSTQSISSNTRTEVGWDNEKIKHNDVYEVDLTNNKITVKEDGIYFVVGNVRWQSPSSGTTLLSEITVNGSIYAPAKGRRASAGDSRPQVSTTPTVVKLSSNDEVRFQVFHQEGSSLDIDQNEATQLTIIGIG